MELRLELELKVAVAGLSLLATVQAILEHDCSAEFWVVCSRICTCFKGVCFRERLIYESTLVGQTKLLS